MAATQSRPRRSPFVFKESPSRIIAMPLLRQVANDQPHVLVGKCRSYPHMPFDGHNHPRRKLVRRLVATAAVGVKPLLTFHPQSLVIWRARRLSLRVTGRRTARP